MVDEAISKIGDRLARARESMGYTFQQLADLSGVAPSTIQKIETGTMMPSIAVMMKIARGLRKKIGFFLDEDETSREVSLVRKKDRGAKGVKGKNYTVQGLSAELDSPEMEGFILTLPPGANSGVDPLNHRGDEIVYCIRGKVTFTINSEEYTLGAGDGLHFKSDLSHYWRNSGRSHAELILVCSIPAFSEKPVLTSAAENKK